MAIVKTLIVKGVARFLTDAYMSTIRSGIWNGNTIGVGYGGTGVTSAKGDLYTPVFLSASGLVPCSAAIPHTTKNLGINGVNYAIYTTANSLPGFLAPTSYGSANQILATNSSANGFVWVDKPVNTWRNVYVGGTSKVGSGNDTKAINYSAGTAISLSFTAAGTGTNLNSNYFSVIISGVANSKDNPGYVAAPKSGSNYLANKVWKTDSNGNPAWRDDANTWVANAVNTAGYVAAPTAADNPNQVWMTNADGKPAWRDINTSYAATSFNTTQTLKVDEWKTVKSDMKDLDAGTYAIQISYIKTGNDGYSMYASGIFSTCHASDKIIDEIPLHVTNSKSGTLWRPYARISENNLQITTNESSGEERQYTIKILKLI